MIGHMYATAFNRRKLNPLTAFFRLTCVTWTLEEGALFGRPLSEFDSEDHDPNYELIRLPRFPARSSITRYLHRGLARVLKSRQFDIVLVDSEPWAWIRWQTWALTRLIQPRSMFGEFSWENVKRPGLKGWILSWIYRAACRTHDFSISGNQACRRILIAHGSHPESNLVAAQLGVEISEFRPATDEEKAQLRMAHQLPRNAFIVGFCGRWTASKGLPELWDVVQSLRAKSGQLDLHLALLGQGDMEDQLSLLQECHAWLHLLPPRPHREVAPFIRCLDLFVLPSKPVLRGPDIWEEQFGHVLIEAMAAAVPTLGSSSGAIPEVIGIAEAIFSHSDIDALRNCMSYWLMNSDERIKLAQTQRQRVLDHYSHEALAGTWSSFLLEQLSRHRRQTPA